MPTGIFTAIEGQVRFHLASIELLRAPRVRALKPRARALIVLEAIPARAAQFPRYLPGGQARMPRIWPEEERVIGTTATSLFLRQLMPQHPRRFIRGRAEGNADVKAVGKLAGESRFAGVV